MDPRALRRLGHSPVAVTQLGFGSAPLGDLYARLDEAAAIGAVEAAWAEGIRLFDTAPLYGYGLAEHRVGHVLRQKPRGEFVLSTKIGRYLVPADPSTIDRGNFAGGLDFSPVYDYSHDGVMRSVEQSMARLGLGRIDILLVHDVDVWTHGSREAVDTHFRTVMESGYKALDRLRSEGSVGAIGVGINEADMCARFARAGDFDCFLLAGRYTLLEQGALDDFLPLTVEKGIGILLGGPYNSGILATGPVPGAKYNYAPAPPDILDRVARIEAVCKRHQVSLPAAAIQFPLGHPSVSSIVPGAVTAAEVARNATLMREPIPGDLWTELRHEGLLRPDAPTP